MCPGACNCHLLERAEAGWWARPDLPGLGAPRHSRHPLGQWGWEDDLQSASMPCVYLPPDLSDPLS